MKLFQVLIIISTPIVIIFFNLLFLIFNQTSYFHIYQKTSVYSQIDKNTANTAVNELIGYFRGKNDLEHNTFSDQAILHLKDIKGLLMLVEIITIISSGLFLIASSYLVFKKKLWILKNAFLLGSMATIILCLVFALLTLFSFNQSFILFHKIAFTNNLWQFAESDNLIKLFPLDFFVAFTKQLIINSVLTSALIAIACFQILKND